MICRVFGYLEDIPISSILTIPKEVPIKEGWGGRHIKYFPPYSFFRMYISGDEEEAKERMKQWYYNRLINEKLCVLPKAQGGMLGGTLFKVLEKKHKLRGIVLKVDLSNVDNKLIMKGIEQGVEERFKLLRSILKYGYKECGNPIYLKRAGDCYILLNGHHRVAAMAACGYRVIKGTTKNNVLIKLIRKIHKRNVNKGYR